MPRKRKEPIVVTETTETPIEAAAVEAPVVDPIAAAQAEAASILERARQEAALIAQAAREEVAAAKAKVAEVQPYNVEPDPVPEGANIVAEPVPNKDQGRGRKVETFFAHITRIDY